MSKQILAKLDSIQADITELKVATAKTEEHLKNLNGSVQRHEGNIKDLYGKTNANSISTAKLYGGVALVGGASGLFIFLLTKLFGG